MYQGMIEETYKNNTAGLMSDENFDWNLAHGMFHLALTQIHLSGCLGNLVRSQDPDDRKSARTVFKAVEACQKIFEPAVKHIEYERMSNELASMSGVITQLIDRIDYMDQISNYLKNERNFKKKPTAQPVENK